MKNLLAMIVLGSISMIAFAEDVSEMPVYQDAEIDVAELNKEQKAKLAAEREQYRLALGIEQNDLIDALFGRK